MHGNVVGPAATAGPMVFHQICQNYWNLNCAVGEISVPLCFKQPWSCDIYGDTAVCYWQSPLPLISLLGGDFAFIRIYRLPIYRLAGIIHQRISKNSALRWETVYRKYSPQKHNGRPKICLTSAGRWLASQEDTRVSATKYPRYYTADKIII
jgi:hypothetical protein